MKKFNFIQFFYKGFRPLIKALIKQQGQEHDSWKKLVKKAIDIKTKASL